MNILDNQYQALLERVLEYGTQKNDRTGTGTLSVFGGQFIHDMSEGFPLLTTKKMAIKTMMTELKWFLKGDTNIKYLVDNGCNIWNGDAYKRYNEEVGDVAMGMKSFIQKIKTQDHFAKKWGELGPIYGKQWRSWGVEYHFDNRGSIDQIANLINDLKNNPDSRRLMVSAWNVGELDGMTLPPCHYGFQCYVSEGKLSLMWNQRSVDTFLGLPFNIASYGTLLLLLCEETGYQPGMLIGNLGDIHIYNNHIDAVNEQLSRSSFELPIIEFSNVDILNGEFDYKLNGYESHPSIKAPLSN
jgi:thymidylate synthase